MTIFPSTGTLNYQTGYITPLSTFQADFPGGNYTISATSSGGTQSGTVAYGGTPFYTSAIPTLTGSTYSTMQGMNAANPFTVTFNSFTPNSNTTPGDAWTFLTIYLASTGAIVFTDGFLPPSTTSVTIPGGTLLPGTAYDFELNHDNRVIGPTPEGLTGEQEFDLRTDGTFSTAIVAPEPSSILLLGAGLLGLAPMLRRRFLRA